MKTFKSILPSVIVTVIMLLMLGSCGEIETNMSKSDYASSVVSLYSDYSKKFDEITQAMQKDQKITVPKLCDEAEVILDDIKALQPPLEFKSEHKNISQSCDDEKEKLELEKEYITFIKDDSQLTDKEKERIKEIEDRMSVLSAKSDKFYNEVDNVARQQLPTQTTKDKNMLNW